MTQIYAQASFDARNAWSVRQPRRPSLYACGVKRALDVLLVLLLMPTALPLILGMALLAALDGHSPFFLQDRLGRDGRVFRMLKIRTMVPNAEARLAAHLAADPAAAEEWTLRQKLARDPRITRIGAFLRRSSLDELPQLLNVLWGDMSLVGPRPMLPVQRALYPGEAYETMRPGITGLWQVCARNQSSFADRADYDASYARRLSFVGDFAILLQTARVVLRQTGC